jgi:hypothetical protein
MKLLVIPPGHAARITSPVAKAGGSLRVKHTPKARKGKKISWRISPVTNALGWMSKCLKMMGIRLNPMLNMITARTTLMRTSIIFYLFSFGLSIIAAIFAVLEESLRSYCRRKLLHLYGVRKY